MTSIVTYVRNLLGSWFHEEPAVRPSFKRDRTDDDFSSDEELPAFKRLKQLKKTKFPDIMESNDKWETRDKKSQNVRYVPIQIEKGHPSTSTPIESSERQSRVKTIPVKLVNVNETSLRSSTSKPRMHTPVRPVIRAVIEDDNDDDDEVTLIETKPESSKNPTKIYIQDIDDDNDQEQQEDVVFIKKVLPPKPVKSYKYFVSKNDRHDKHDTNTNDENIQYYSMSRKLNDRNANISPKTYSKFIAPPGIVKSYKKAPTPVARWMQIPKSSNLLQSRNRVLNVNGNARATLSEVFNLDEKRNYQELIRRVAETTRNVSIGKPTEIINLAEDSACFRNTQRSQRNALNEIRFMERGLNAEKELESTSEYGPITVASINSSDSEVEVVPSEASTSSSVRIVPLNTLKDSYRDHPVTSQDWVTKINTKYKKKNQNNKEKIRDVSRESDIISKVNYEQRLAQLEHKLKYELSIPESLIEEPQPEAALPQLTEAQEKLIDRAIGPGPSGQLLVEKFNLRIHRRDLQTLCGLNWLNDEVINFYMNLLMQRSERRRELPRVYATNTFFYPKLMQAGQAGLRRWTRKVDIFAHDLLVVPVHLGVHWCLGLVDFRSKRVSYLDSMGGRNPACLAALLQYLRDEHRDKKGAPFDDQGWSTECLKDIPQQMNGSDCGMFACTFAEFSCRNAPYTFSQQHMPYLRRKAALEILQGELLL